MVKIKFVKDTEKAKIGEVGEASKKSAESYVKNGYAEYVVDEKPKTEGVDLKKLWKEHKASKGDISLYHNGILNVTPSSEISLQDCVGMIKEENDLIEAIRKETDKNKRDKLKKKLSYVTFGGTFTNRGKKNLITGSGYASFDLDHLPNLEEVKKKLSENKFVSLVFISPSGDGLKVVVKIPRVVDDEEYKKYWLSIAEHLNIEEQDEACKDISRACFLSVDKEPYYNPDSEVYTDQVEYAVVNPTRTEELNEEDEKIINSIKDKWEKGDRQKLAMSLAGYLRKEKKYGFDRAAAIVRGICEEKGDVDVSERLTVVQQTYKKDEGEVTGIKGLRALNVEVEEFILKDYLISKGINKKTGKEEFGVDIDGVAKYIENKLEVRTIFGIREETIELYGEGIWTTKGKGIIKSKIEELLGVYSKNNAVSEILEKIKRRTETSREETEVIPDYKRCVANGVLDLEKGKVKFLEHSKEYNFRTKFPMTYNPEAKCPRILKFMEETFDSKDLLQVQEWFGFHLPRRYFLKKAVLAYGPSDTGKTVLVNLLTIFVGKNVSGLSLQEISRAKPFDLLDLKDKDANICDDLSSADMKAVGGFKMAVGDGMISGEQKFGDKFKFRNTAKDTNTCNKIPSPGEDIDDEAYYNRILLMPLENVISEKNKNRKLIDELTTDEELSGLLNWAIEGYKRLIKQNGFSNEKSPDETKFLMVQNGNSLARFASEVLIHQDGSKVDKETMYQVYCAWCRIHKPQLSPDSKDKIGKNLTTFASFTQSASTGAERYWLNVKLNEDTDSYDTFSKTIRDISEDGKVEQQKISNVISKPVIDVSAADTYDASKEKENKDTSDTFTKEELELAGITKEDYEEISNE